MPRWYIYFILLSNPLFGQNRLADSLKQALESHPNEDTVRVQILNQLAFEKHFNFPYEAIDYSAAARELASRIHDYKGISLSYRHTGLAFWTQGSYEYAMKAFVAGLKIADSCRFTQIQADLNGNIGLIHNSTGEYKLALRAFEASLNLQRQLKNVKRQIVMLNNIGDCYRNIGDASRALEYYTESMELGKPINYLVETNNRNIGNVFESMGNYGKALEHYVQSKKISDLYNAKRERCLIRLSLASLHKSNGDLSVAKQEAEEALTIAQAGNLRSIIRDCNLFLAGVSEAMNKSKEALHHLRQYILYSDSLEILSSKSNIAGVRLEYEIQKREAEINTLKIQSQQKETELRLQNYLLALAIVIVVLLVSLLIFGIYHYRFQRNLNTLLKEKNRSIDQVNQKLKDMNGNLEELVKQRTAILEEQNKALTDYAHFNAHRVRAPLASIRGLVHLLLGNNAGNQREVNPEILDHLKSSCQSLDEVIREINARIDDGLDAYENRANLKD